MGIKSVKTLPKLIWGIGLQVIAVTVLTGFFLFLFYGFVHHYQQQRLHMQQLAELLAQSASTIDGASLVARQVSIVLKDDPSIQNIVFYSTDYPISTLNQADIERSGNNWYTALTADTISFNRAVTAHTTVANQGLSALTANRLVGVLPNDTSLKQMSAATNALVGYINITLDMHKLRQQWLHKIMPLWLLSLVLAITILRLIFRKLSQASEDITELAGVCDLLAHNLDIEQLPIIQQRFEFKELTHIKQAFILLFERLRKLRQEHESLADLEQQLHYKDKSLEVQRHNFQSMITHELKTSLNAISGGLQLLDNYHLSYEQQDTLTIIRKGSQHLETTLEQIIQLNKIEKGHITVNVTNFNPLQIIADLLAEFEPIAKQKGLEIVSRIHHIDYTLEGDASKIKQVIATLIDNAIKFTDIGQVILDSQLTHFNNSIRWQLKIIDTGIGISANYIDDIFTPFFQVDSSNTRQYEGVGMGLSIIKQVLQLIDASVEVISAPNEGSQFTVTIPLRNKYDDWRQMLLQGLQIVYCHADGNDTLAKALHRLGATIIYQQCEQMIHGQLADKKVDMIMFVEDILPQKVAQLAQMIRSYETTHRALLIYWYPPHLKYDLYSLDHELKIAGIDYCESATQDSHVLKKLLKKWLGRV